MSYALEIEGLEKVYANGLQALKGIDLRVAQGDFFALLGPNGAGKSTTIGVICSLVNKTAGTVRVNGVDIDEDFPRAKRHLGVVPQEFNFNVFESVEDILIHQAGYYGIPLKIARERIDTYLAKLGLTDKRHTRARMLSGGMKRRLMIARALTHEPSVLILDEPTAGVDIEMRRSMYDFLREINEAGTTIILTTHYLEEAEALCDRIAIINKGEIIAAQTKADLLASACQRTLHLSLKTPPPLPLPTALAALGAQWRDGRLSIRFDSATSNAVDILHKVRLAGFEASDISTAEPDLQDVFLSLTK